MMDVLFEVDINYESLGILINGNVAIARSSTNRHWRFDAAAATAELIKVPTEEATSLITAIGNCRSDNIRNTIGTEFGHLRFRTGSVVYRSVRAESISNLARVNFSCKAESISRLVSASVSAS
uniref:Uncharacterized protein n=1 Tax=Leptocylindrus danicus TaxID=163516 RepID=A0A7S2LSC4_9STRA